MWTLILFYLSFSLFFLLPLLLSLPFLQFFNATSCIIGGRVYTLNDIESGVLRVNRKPVGAFRRPFGRNDPRYGNMSLFLSLLQSIVDVDEEGDFLLSRETKKIDTLQFSGGSDIHRSSNFKILTIQHQSSYHTILNFLPHYVNFLITTLHVWWEPWSTDRWLSIRVCCSNHPLTAHWAHTHAHAHTHTHTHTHTYTHIHTHTCTYSYTHSFTHSQLTKPRYTHIVRVSVA